MRKIVVFAVSFILILGVAYTLFYMNQYAIEPEEDAIHTGLADWQTSGEQTGFEFNILGITPINQTNTHIVLFETDDHSIGYARLVKGWNGKYKITNSGWGTNLVKYVDIQTSEGMYGILIGKNPGLEIDHIVAESPDKEFGFTAAVSNAETFVRYQKLPSGLKEAFPADITLYDDSGKVLNPLRKEW
ncbi:hypothetical protein QWY16_09250 [Planococcus shenhongbingii]|uniref:hypothetical protein n=1 Tax=Planococcus shenhongbingii TaxID=3058398 RepID=UPI002633CEAC|nr:hypothetical protein [Planococcus sp. N016]WKA60270.1 hypothetical protein QWY16_09250 [Planococcus sp. N016]